MSVYYNEFDPKAAAWLRELIKQGHLPEGDVDERSIVDVRPEDLTGYIQCHFFAGIGGWPLALRLAGWPDDRPIWTGSCPCQPFSQAGKGKGIEDERHLWPEFRRLISKCNPSIVFGEQVAAKAGRVWLNGVRTDLETLGYAVGASDLCAAGIGAPHIRQRLYWVAKSQGQGLYGGQPRLQGSVGEAESYGAEVGGVGHSHGSRLQGQSVQSEKQSGEVNPWSPSLVVSCTDNKQRRIPTEPAFFPLAPRVPNRVVRLRGYGNAIVPPLAAEFIQAASEAILGKDSGGTSE